MRFYRILAADPLGLDDWITITLQDIESGEAHEQIIDVGDIIDMVPIWELAYQNGLMAHELPNVCEVSRVLALLRLWLFDGVVIWFE
jgi:hypothetical protein